MPKTVLQYQCYATILNEYLHLEEFSTLSELTIKGKRLALTQLINYLGEKKNQNKDLEDEFKIKK